MQLRIASLLLVLASLAAPAAASSALGGRKMRGGLDAQALERELSAAMCEALGCGGRVDEERLRGIERDLEAMWRTRPRALASGPSGAQGPGGARPGARDATERRSGA